MSIKSLFVFCLLLCCLSCQDVFECILGKHPQLNKSELKHGSMGHFYFEEIPAEIDNEAADNSYYYYFSVWGELPEGLDYNITERSVFIEGYPNETGIFSIQINLSVEQIDDYYEVCESEFNDCDGLCEDYTSKQFDLIIN